jgi:hypothetical protein
VRSGAPGTSDALVSPVDLPASFAALARVELGQPDAHTVIDALLGSSTKGRVLEMSALLETIRHEGRSR